MTALSNMLEDVNLTFTGSTAQKMKYSIKDFFSKCDQIRSFLQIWSHLRKKSLMEDFFFFCSDKCKVYVKNFPSTRVKCMQDYIKPSFRENLYLLIIRVSTNNISKNKQPKQIAKWIVEEAISVKDNSCELKLDIRYQICDIRYNSQKRWSSTKSCRDRLLLEVIIQRKDKTITTRHLNGSSWIYRNFIKHIYWIYF